MRFSATVEPTGGAVVVEGDVDTASAPALHAVMRSAVATDGAPLVLDMTRVMYLDSGGIAALCAFVALHPLEILVTAGSAVEGTMIISGLTRWTRVRQVDQA